MGGPAIHRAWKKVKERQRSVEGHWDKVGLYVHIPFCRSRCLYCNLLSFPEVSEDTHERYLRALKTEIRLLDFGRQTPLATFYIAGGTPTIMSAERLERLLKSLHASFDLTRVQQGMIEVSPLTATREKIRVFKRYGITKVTMGVQSLDRNILQINARPQDKECVLKCYSNLRAAGIPHVNIDLIAGLPGQSMDSFLQSLDAIIKLKPDTLHINFFNPQIYTTFYRTGRRLTLADIFNRQMMLREGSRRIASSLPSSLEREGFEKENQQFYFNRYFNSSTIGIGYGAISNASGFLNYGKPTNFKDYMDALEAGRLPRTFGYRLNRDLEMRAYVIKNLEHTGSLSAEQFQAIFHAPLRKTFKDEIAFLEKEKKVGWKDGVLTFVSPARLDQLLYSKIFYDERTLKEIEILRRSGRRSSYSQSIDYGLLCHYQL